MTAGRRSNTPKEWALAIGGGLALSAALVWELRGGGDVDPAPTPAITIAPPLGAPVAVLLPPAVAAPPDLKLAGLRAGPDGGMVIVVAGGRQVLLRPGRSLAGGVRLVRVEPRRAILAGPGGELVLAFADAAPSAKPAATSGGDPTAWLTSLTPQQGPGGSAGWRVTSLTAVPGLAKAGLQIGDVVTAANGIELISDEKILELTQELAANGRLRLAYRRGAQRREAIITR